MKKHHFILMLIAALIAAIACMFFYPQEAKVIKLTEQRASKQTTTMPVAAISVVPTRAVHNRSAFIAISKAYQSTNDLYALYAKYRNSENADEKYFAWNALQFCARYALPGRGNVIVVLPKSPPYKLLDGPANSAPSRDIADRNLAARCAGFTNMTVDALKAENKALGKEVQNGDSYAAIEYKLIALDKIGKKDEAHLLAKNAFLSQEPDAIVALTGYMQTLWDDAEHKNTNENIEVKDLQSVKPDTRAMGFHLAACDLGLDCSAHAVDVEGMCVYGGSCEMPMEEALKQLLTPAEIDDMLNKRDFYVQAIKAGDYKAVGL
ncbi:hypothetical protein [Glaciimonas soli]|uniref:Uncharacterized protein n=1 Tax=Glaciimonas soli TaxID=2590999 RepID=A0A843YV11_9BURK|nr:hypothetical protein [Glaciimonas soli]MQR00456.1 hypothetical protein [Glaciimonas soli]